MPALLSFLEAHPPEDYKGQAGRPKQRHAFLASLVMLACLTRRAPAVLGKLDEFAALMGVCRRTAWSDLEYLTEIGLLVKMADYKVGRSYGRNGEPIDHRQLANWYGPGKALRAIWEGFTAEQARKALEWEARFPSPTAPAPAPAPRYSECKIYDPSLRSNIAKDLLLPAPTQDAAPSKPKKSGFAALLFRANPSPKPHPVEPPPVPADDERVLTAAEEAGVPGEVLRGLYRLFPDVAVTFAKNTRAP